MRLLVSVVDTVVDVVVVDLVVVAVVSPRCCSYCYCGCADL